MLKLGYEGGKHGGAKKYFHHLRQLNLLKETHITVFMQSLKENHPDAIVVDLQYPRSSREVPNVFSEYGEEDVLFIHAHGNRSLIGTGGFYLDPTQLAQNLLQMGLSKQNPPTIFIWSCNSGKSKAVAGKTFAYQVRRALEKQGCKHLGVVGINGYIYFRAPEERVTFTRKRDEEAEDSNSANHVSISKEEAMQINVTPGIVVSPGEGMSIWTMVKKNIVDPRRERKKAQRESPTIHQRKRSSARTATAATATPVKTDRRSTLRSFHQGLQTPPPVNDIALRQQLNQRIADMQNSIKVLSGPPVSAERQRLNNMLDEMTNCTNNLKRKSEDKYQSLNAFQGYIADPSPVTATTTTTSTAATTTATSIAATTAARKAAQKEPSETPRKSKTPGNG